MVIRAYRQRSVLYVLLAVSVGFVLGAVVFNWRELRSFSGTASHRVVAKHTEDNDDVNARSLAARLPRDVIHQVLRDNPDMNKDYAPKVTVKWIYEDWAFGINVYDSAKLHFLAKYTNGKWKLLDEADCRGMSFVKKHSVPSIIASRLIKESWLQPEYDALYEAVAQDFEYTDADLNGGSAVINIDWISANWAQGSAGNDDGGAGLIACKKNGKWKVLDHAQDVRPMSTAKEFGIPDNIIKKLVASGWFDPKADAEEAESKRHANAKGTTSLSRGIRVVSCNWYTKPDYGTNGVIECVGQVENYGNTTARYVRISVTYNDGQGQVVNTDYGYTDPADIPPGRRSPFKIYSDYYQSAKTAQMQVSCN